MIGLWKYHGGRKKWKSIFIFQQQIQVHMTAQCNPLSCNPDVFCLGPIEQTVLIKDEVLQSIADLCNLTTAPFVSLLKLLEGPSIQVTFLPQSFLQFLHHLGVSLGDGLVVDNRPGIVHSDHTAGLSLDNLRSFPGLVDELCRHSGELGQIPPDVDTLGINLRTERIIILIHIREGFKKIHIIF